MTTDVYTVTRIALPIVVIPALPPLFWAGNFVLGRAVRADIAPLALSFWRWVLALAILLPFAWPALRRDWPIIRQHSGILALLGVLGVANYNSLVYIGLQQTSATNAVLMVSTTPVLIVLTSFILLGQWVNRWQVLGIITSLLGVACIVLKGQWASLLTLSLNPGDVWVLSAGISWALYSVCLIRWRPAGLAMLSFLTSTVMVGVLVILPFYLWELSVKGGFALTPVTLGSIVYVALLPSIAAYIFWNRAVAELGANRCGQYLHLMPAFGTLLSWLLLDERMYAFHWLGIGLIALGIYFTTALGRRA